MKQQFSLLKYELNEELTNILSYWRKNTVDKENGGFLGRITHHNKVVEKASKGVILNSRILWSFAAAANHLDTVEYQEIITRSYEYLRDHFMDRQCGGVFWELDYQGNAINKRKQVYAQAFTIYALSEYYLYSQNEEAKTLAIDLFDLIEKHSKDEVLGGYLEAFDHDWSELEDMRLSHKDMNASKTMNTHLHVLEAYTALLRIYESSMLRDSLEKLVNLFLHRFLNSENHHYHLFFNDRWELQSSTVSYGHDIETAWLVIEAAKALENEELVKASESVAIKVADTFLREAIDHDGAVINEKDLSTQEVDTDRHWWPQVEAMIGLAFAHKATLKQRYVRYSISIWQFIKDHLIDQKHGEWYFRVDKDGKIYTEEDKVSMWKAPYHTTRACIMLNSI